MSSTDAILQVEVKLRRAGESFALDVAFEAPVGITILFGPSGSGKSTTLGAIAGLSRPDEGRIALGEHVWFDGARGVFCPIHKRGVAYVFQSLALFPHLSALENVAYGINPKLPAKEQKDRARSMLTRMKVGHLESRRPRTFSGGEAQRVALARAFAMSPRVVLLDEPFSAMDRALRRELARDVRQVVDEERLPLIHVTHHRNEARALGDRVVLIENGRIAAQGPIDLLPAVPPEEREGIEDTPVPTLRRPA
jgi:molybdate transport system ATP-binding protein